MSTPEAGPGLGLAHERDGESSAEMLPHAPPPPPVGVVEHLLAGDADEPAVDAAELRRQRRAHRAQAAASSAPWMSVPEQ